MSECARNGRIRRGEKKNNDAQWFKKLIQYFLTQWVALFFFPSLSILMPTSWLYLALNHFHSFLYIFFLSFFTFNWPETMVSLLKKHHVMIAITIKKKRRKDADDVLPIW